MGILVKVHFDFIAIWRKQKLSLRPAWRTNPENLIDQKWLKLTRQLRPAWACECHLALVTFSQLHLLFKCVIIYKEVPVSVSHTWFFIANPRALDDPNTSPIMKKGGHPEWRFKRNRSSVLIAEKRSPLL